MKKRKIIAFLLVMCMAASLFLTGCGDKSLSVEDVEGDPISYLKKGGEMVEEAWSFGDGQLSDLLQNVMKKGQVELNLDMTDYKLKNVLSIDGDTIANELTGSLAGQDIDLMAYLDSEDVAVQSNALLGSEDTYGLNFDTFLKQGTESNLARLMQLEEADFDELKEMLKGKDDSKSMLETYQQKIETIEENIWELFQEADITVAEEKVTIADTEVDAIKVSIPMTKEICQSVIDETFSLFEDMEGASEAIAELKAEMEAVEVTGTYDWYLNKETGALMQCNADLNATEGETVVAEKAQIVYGVDPAAAGKIDMDITMESDGETIGLTGKLTKKTEDKTDYITLDFAMNMGDEELKLAADIEHNTENKEYTLNVSMDDGVQEYALKITGIASVEKDAAEFSVTSIKMDDVTIDTNVSLKLTTAVTMPEKPEYKDILTLDDETLSGLVMNASMNAAIISSGGYYTDTGYDETECTFCYNEATQEVSYLGEYLGVCDDCAQDVADVIAGDYCDVCWTETSDLTVVEEDGISYRLCPDCYAETFSE